jgi:hypothetical protein
MDRLVLDRRLLRGRVSGGSEPLSVWKRTSTIVIARRLRQYREGEKVRILRGSLAGQILTVHQSANDWVMLKESASNRDVMSKGNVEPESGFTEDEMNQAERVSRKGG